LKQTTGPKSACSLKSPTYKEQYGIENNFRFLKDPIIVNDTFLKKAERIEALGFILLISLMLWNLIQLTIVE
jgi:transposase